MTSTNTGTHLQCLHSAHYHIQTPAVLRTRADATLHRSQPIKQLRVSKLISEMSLLLGANQIHFLIFTVWGTRPYRGEPPNGIICHRGTICIIIPHPQVWALCALTCEGFRFEHLPVFVDCFQFLLYILGDAGVT